MKLQITILAALAAGLITYLRPAHAEPPTRSIEQRLDAIVTEACPKADEPGLAVLVMVDGKPLLRKGYGVADLQAHAKLAPDSIFRIGSITKQFTAVCVLQLVAAGKVSLSDPITKYVPDFNTHGQTITIENLLTHTSGLFNITALPDFIEHESEAIEPRKSVARIEDKPLEFNPGEQFKYSNTNYILLGMVIEKASGQTYAQYLQDHICKPLGLNDTRYSPDDASTPRHARGFERGDSGDWRPARPISMTQPFAAGAIESTVDELAKWSMALSDGKLLDRELLERAWTPYAPTGGKSNYGYGWSISRPPDAPDERWIRHNGGISGFVSSAVWIPERKVFVAVLSNAMGSGADPGQLTRKLALEAVGRPAKTRVAIAVDEDALQKLVGLYEMSPDFKLNVTRQGKQLFVQATGQGKAEIFAESPTMFFAKVVDAQFEFKVDGDRATSLTLHQNGRSTPANRVQE